MKQQEKIAQVTALSRTLPATADSWLRTRSSALAKRILDIVGSLFLLLLTAPLWIAIAVVVSLDGGPVFFSQMRAGKGTRLFGCLKFRTMIIGADNCLQEYLALHPSERAEWMHNQKLALDPRITPVGQFLRLTSLDELPQLINVLRGEMSLVGPRPITIAEFGHYRQHISDYASVLPGITGLWQISSRSNVDYERRVELDCEYVRRRTMLLDIEILFRTANVVLFRNGAR